MQCPWLKSYGTAMVAPCSEKWGTQGEGCSAWNFSTDNFYAVESLPRATCHSGTTGTPLIHKFLRQHTQKNEPHLSSAVITMPPWRERRRVERKACNMVIWNETVGGSEGERWCQNNLSWKYELVWRRKNITCKQNEVSNDIRISIANK